MIDETQYRNYQLIYSYQTWYGGYSQRMYVEVLSSRVKGQTGYSKILLAENSEYVLLDINQTCSST